MTPLPALARRFFLATLLASAPVSRANTPSADPPAPAEDPALPDTDPSVPPPAETAVPDGAQPAETAPPQGKGRGYFGTVPGAAPAQVVSIPVENLLLDGTSYEERSAALLRYVAACTPKPGDETSPKAAVPAYVARILLGVDTGVALEKLDAAAAARIARFHAMRAEKPGTPHALDPFDKVALVNAYFLCKDKIPAATAAKIREYCGLYAHKVWRGYGAWNYRLMNDGAGFLAAEEWPDLADQDGLDAAGIRAATRARLLGYFEEIARRNYTEYGCPIYLAVNLSATRMIAEYARDAEVRNRATLALDAMMVDIACTWNQGYNAGSAARAKYWGSTNTSPENMNATAAAAWLYFGAHRPIRAASIGWIHSAWMAAPGSYRLPAIVSRIARERSAPVTHRGFVAGSGKDSVHRTTYHSPSYSLGSQWDQASSPTSGLYKESRRNMLKWVSPQPSSTFAVCMENPRRPYRLQEKRANALGYGENPFSQYLQADGTLIGIYAVPADYPYYKLYAPFPTTGSIVKRKERGRWILCHNGSMLMAFRSIKPHRWGSRWDNNDMLWCDARNNGWILETTELGPFAGGGADAELDRFGEALEAKTRINALAIDGPRPRLGYTALSGKHLDLTWLPHGQPYAGHSKIDGRPVAYGTWPIHASPHVFQPVAPPILKLQHGGETVVYNFERWTRETLPK